MVFVTLGQEFHKSCLKLKVFSFDTMERFSMNGAFSIFSILLFSCLNYIFLTRVTQGLGFTTLNLLSFYFFSFLPASMY